jgi:hypothetical protein
VTNLAPGRPLRTLLGTPAVAVVDQARAQAWDGAGAHHVEDSYRHATATLETGRTEVLDPEAVACGSSGCPLAHAVVAPVAGRSTGRPGGTRSPARVRKRGSPCMSVDQLLW